MYTAAWIEAVGPVMCLCILYQIDHWFIKADEPRCPNCNRSYSVLLGHVPVANNPEPSLVVVLHQDTIAADEHRPNHAALPTARGFTGRAVHWASISQPAMQESEMAMQQNEISEPSLDDNLTCDYDSERSSGSSPRGELE